jgi:uncharacterized protein (DUF1330 family)
LSRSSLAKPPKTAGEADRMSAYIVARLFVTDSELLTEYGAAARATLKTREADYLIRSPTVETLEGDAPPTRVVVLRFPTREAALEWFNSEEYQAAAELRRKASSAEILLVEG